MTAKTRVVMTAVCLLLLSSPSYAWGPKDIELWRSSRARTSRQPRGRASVIYSVLKRTTESDGSLLWRSGLT